AEVERHGAGLAVRVEELDREILGLLDEGRVRRAVERGRHALDGGAAMIAQHLQRDGIGTHHSVSRTRLPSPSARARQPAGPSTAESGWVTMAGPVKLAPGLRSWRR